MDTGTGSSTWVGSGRDADAGGGGGGGDRGGYLHIGDKIAHLCANKDFMFLRASMVPQVKGYDIKYW